MRRGLLNGTVAGAATVATALAVVPRWRSARRVRALVRRLESARVDERIEIARHLVDEGLSVSASELLLLVRTCHDPALLQVVAQAVRDAPVGSRPSANVRELLHWSDVELGSRQGTR